jgi:hypothetical protein
MKNKYTKSQIKSALSSLYADKSDATLHVENLLEKFIDEKSYYSITEIVDLLSCISIDENLIKIVKYLDSNYNNYTDGEYFEITSVSREDLFRFFGVNAQLLDDIDMYKLAIKLADDYLEHLFWDSLEIIASCRFEDKLFKESCWICAEDDENDIPENICDNCNSEYFQKVVSYDNCCECFGKQGANASAKGRSLSAVSVDETDY